MSQETDTATEVTKDSPPRHGITRRMVVMIGAAVLLVAIILAGINIYRAHQSPSVSSLKVIETFSGQGDETLPAFNIQGDGSWRIAWTCQSAGSSGTFSIFVQSVDRTEHNVTITPPSCGAGGKFIHGGSGSYLLQITAPGTWTVKVYDYRP